MAKDTAPRAQQTRRNRHVRLCLLLASTLMALLLGEAALRLAGGYRLGGLRLRHVLADAPDVKTQFAVQQDLVGPFVARWQNERKDLDTGWLRASPPPLSSPPPLDKPLLPQAQWLFHYYVLNAVLLRAMWVPGQGLPAFAGVPLPAAFAVFEPPDGGVAPRFRYPASRTLPTGLRTNSFGFRGRELAADKPPATIRIAFVGASTTVEAHGLPHSAPELIEHWLSLWAERRGLAVRFQTLNAAREAIQSADIRAIVAHELLPLAVDYVVYYEGANQCLPGTMARHVRIEGEYRLASPPPGIAGAFDETETADTTWLDRLAQYSAAAQYLRSSLRGSALLVEPPKPKQAIELPPAFDGQGFDLAAADGLLECGAIRADLDAIRLSLSRRGARLVLCTFARLAHDGMQLHPVYGHNVHVQLNREFWPLRYDTVRRLTELQNRFFAAWARQHDVDLIDVAADLPADARLYIDSIHHTELGVRLKAWVLFSALTRILARDLEAGVVPVPDDQRDAVHPHLGAPRLLTPQDLDAGR